MAHRAVLLHNTLSKTRCPHLCTSPSIFLVQPLARLKTNGETRCPFTWKMIIDSEETNENMRFRICDIMRCSGGAGSHMTQWGFRRFSSTAPCFSTSVDNQNIGTSIVTMSNPTSSSIPSPATMENQDDRQDLQANTGAPKRWKRCLVLSLIRHGEVCPPLFII